MYKFLQKLQVLFFVVLLTVPFGTNAEGTREVSPLSSSITALGLLGSVGNGSYLGCPDDNRIYFNIQNAATENLYFGFRWTDYSTGGGAVQTVMYMKIFNNAGVQQGSTFTLATTGAGVIANYNAAFAGPNIGGATPAGYTPRSFDPSASGNYYIEFYKSTDGGATQAPLATWTKTPYWDLTVATGANVKKPGRVYCNKWSFVAVTPSTFLPEGSASSEAFIYSYSNDSTYLKLDIRSGFRPIAFNVTMNSYGVANTGNWGTVDRRSINVPVVNGAAVAPSLTDGYKLFLNEPDNIVFPYAPVPQAPSIPSPPMLGCAPNGPFSIRYQLYKNADVFVLLNLNGIPDYQAGTKDRLIEQPSRLIGLNSYTWDGKDGLGAVVPAGTQISYSIIARGGRNNFPVYDAEINKDGFAFIAVQPQQDDSLFVYWDDAGLASTGACAVAPSDNQNNNTGVGYSNSLTGKKSPAHAWNGNGNNGDTRPAPPVGGNDALADAFQCNDFGNVRVINTWAWAVEVTGTNTIVLACINVSGTVVNDANASAANTFNNISQAGEGGTNATGLFALLIDSVTGTVIASVPIAANGTYTFTGVPINIASGLGVQISSTNVPVNSAPGASTIGGGYSATTPTVRPVSTGTANVTGIDFGVQKPPTSVVTTTANQLNPGGNNSYTIPPTDFVNSDDGTGEIVSITITAFPTNATSITINGIAYTSATFPGGGITIPTNAAGDPLQTISVDPIDGVNSVSIPFVSTDNAGAVSAPGAVNIPFVTGAISGNVFNDVNGTTNNTVDGSGNNAGGLNAVLVDAAGNVVAVAPVGANGTYNFTGLNVGDYKVVITTATPNTGDPAPASSLPAGWQNTAENIGSSTGNDGITNGTSNTISLSTANTSTTNVNFGIQQAPTANTATENTQLNPGDTTSATVASSLFGGTDANGGVIDSIRITSFPTNATSITINGNTYISGTFPSGGVTVVAPGGVPTNPILVDPLDGSVTVSIPYKTKDNAGVESTNTGSVNIPFTTTIISGTVFNDTNGNNNGSVDGTGTNAGGLLNAILIDATGNVVASVPVNADGTYSFTDINAGIYSVVISTTVGVVGNPAPSASVPAGWQNTGENNGTGAGSDGTPNGTSLSFVATVTPTTNINFGVNEIPTANTENIVALNPTMGIEYTVPNTLFGGTDPTTNTVTSIKITAFPTNADSIIVNGVTYKASNFPPAGITIPTNAAGEPTQTILVDPVDGNTTVVIPYVTIDAAGAQSALGSATIEFLEPVAVTGQLIHDANNSANGTFTNIQNGTEQGTNTGTPTYAYLVDPNTGNILQIDTLAPDGTFGFGNITPNTDVKVVLSTTGVTVGNPSPAPSLASGWVNTSPLDTTFNVGSPMPAIVTNINFGAQQPPISDTSIFATQILPRGTDNYTVPPTAFENTDGGAGTLVSITIISFPTNATSITINGMTYTAGTFPPGGVVVPTDADGNPLQTITVDPAPGADTVAISFVSTDNTGLTSLVPGVVKIPFVQGNINGNVFNDVNGLKNTTVDGSGTDAGGLFANLVDANNNIIASVAVDPATGAYNFNDVGPGAFTVQLSNVAGTPNTTAPSTSSLPASWVNTGENIGTSTGSDGSVNGISKVVNVTPTTPIVNNVNFGVQQIPTAGKDTAAGQVNPSGTNTVTVASILFNGTDANGGTIDSIKIVNFPSNATSISIGGVAYTAANFPANGVTVEAPNGQPVVSINIDPIDGSVIVNIPYVTIDNAGAQSTDTGSAALPFTTATIAGNVFNDVNGLSNNIVDGAGTNTGGLNAVLLDAQGNVIAVTPVGTNGAYAFTGLNTGNYNVVITTANPIIGGITPASTLPMGWVNTGENIGTAAGNDGDVNGLGTSISITPITDSIKNVNFGIQEKPFATTATAPSSVNPGGGTFAPIPAATFVTGDNNGGIIDSIIITAFPNNADAISIDGVVYTASNFPANGVTVQAAGGVPNVPILVNPINGAVTVGIPYKTKDNAGFVSDTAAIAKKPFTTATVDGSVFSDLNGATDNLVNGSGTNAGGLFANLIDANGNVVQTIPVSALGTFTFTNVDGGNYSVVITTAASTIGAPAPASSLPNNWVNTAENNSTTTGTDGTPNGTSATFTVNNNVSEINFGIQQLPTAIGSTDAPQINPGSANTTSVTPSLFSGTDPNGGFVDSIRITTFPTNATSITINGMTYTSGTFPAAGITVVAPGGVPTNPILIDPIDGAVTVAIPFVVKDNAGFESPNVDSAKIPFALSSVTGNVYNDVNGNKDGNVNGSGTNGNGLNAILVNANGDVVATTPVATDGTYTFTNVAGGNYTVLLSTTPGTVGSPAPSPSLNTTWVSTGENNGAGAGSDGTVNTTSIPFTVGSAPVSNINFGIENKPTAVSNSKVALNPLLGNTEIVPATLFGGTDTITNTIDSLRITAFPSNTDSISINGIFYTAVNWPSNGVTVPTSANGQPTVAILVDPINGDVTVDIPYVTIDGAGVASDTAKASVIFLTPVAVSGKLINDADNSANGTNTNIQTGTEQGTNTGTPIYAYIIDPVTGDVIAKDTLQPDGTYAFGGLPPNTDIKIVISTIDALLGDPTPASILPPGWIATSPLDTSFNTGSPIPALITDINFGAQQPPSTADSTLAPQANPNGTVDATVPAGTFKFNDAPTGKVDSIKIVSFPTDATTITINGMQYTSSTFPTNGVSIPVDNTGLPTYPILVDPTDGAVIVVIPFVSIDNGGLESPDTGKVNVPFTPIVNLSGNVFNDLNDLEDNTVNGAGLQNPNNVPLYINVLDSNNNVVATVPVDANGFYTVSNIPGNTTYTLQLSTNQGTLGNTAPATNLPNGWNNVGENIGTTAGNDGNANGLIKVVVQNTDTTNINFGIKKPIVDADPDVNATFVNTFISGNVSTNDENVPNGSTYGNPPLNPNNPSSSTPTINADGSYTFTSPVAGVYTFIVPVTLPNGDVINVPLVITVLDPEKNNAPIANVDQAVTPINTQVILNTLGNDIPGNIGSTLDSTSVLVTTQPVNGTATVNSTTGAITYQPNTGFVGKDTLYYQVVDADGDTATAMQIITVLPLNAANTTQATDNFNTTEQDVAVSDNALGNDSDGEGDTQAVVPQTIAVSEGTFVIDAAGNYTFTPAPGFSGSVNFPYSVYDNNANKPDTANATIYILVLPKPKQNPDVNITFVNAPVSGDASTNDKYIPEGSTYVQPDANINNPDGGTNLPTLNADGTYTFTSTTPGVYTWLVPVLLANGDTIEQVELKITVLDTTIINALPVANTDLASTPIDVPVTLATLANDKGSIAGLNPSTVLVTIAPKNGSTSVDPLTGNITYSPSSGFTGKDTLFYSVTDSSGKTVNAMQIITILPPNSANTTVASDDFNVISFGVPVSGDALKNDMDPDGDAQSVVPQTTTILGKGTLVLNADGTYIFTPIAGYVGAVNFPYEVIDARGGTANATIYFIVRPTIPLNTIGLTLNGKINKNDNRLDWICTSTEDVISYTLLRKAYNSDTFQTIATVNATTSNSYNFTDNTFINGANLYVIQANLQNGTTANSNSIVLKNERVHSVIVYPNPAKENIQLHFTIPTTDVGKIIMMNSVGQIVSTTTLASGTTYTSISVSNNATGMYTILCNVDNTITTLKVMVE